MPVLGKKNCWTRIIFSSQTWQYVLLSSIFYWGRWSHLCNCFFYVHLTMTQHVMTSNAWLMANDNWRCLMINGNLNFMSDSSWVGSELYHKSGIFFLDDSRDNLFKWYCCSVVISSCPKPHVCAWGTMCFLILPCS